MWAQWCAPCAVLVVRHRQHALLPQRQPQSQLLWPQAAPAHSLSTTWSRCTALALAHALCAAHAAAGCGRTNDHQESGATDRHQATRTSNPSGPGSARARCDSRAQQQTYAAIGRALCGRVCVWRSCHMGWVGGGGPSCSAAPMWVECHRLQLRLTAHEPPGTLGCSLMPSTSRQGPASRGWCSLAIWWPSRQQQQLLQIGPVPAAAAALLLLPGCCSQAAPVARCQGSSFGCQGRWSRRRATAAPAQHLLTAACCRRVCPGAPTSGQEAGLWAHRTRSSSWLPAACRPNTGSASHWHLEEGAPDGCMAPPPLPPLK